MAREKVKAKMLEVLGFSLDSSEEEEKVFERLENYLWLKLDLAIANRLNKEEREKYRALEKAQEIRAFLQDKVPDLDELMEKTAKEGIHELRTALLG